MAFVFAARHEEEEEPSSAKRRCSGPPRGSAVAARSRQAPRVLLGRVAAHPASHCAAGSRNSRWLARRGSGASALRSSLRARAGPAILVAVARSWSPPGEVGRAVGGLALGFSLTPEGVSLIGPAKGSPLGRSRPSERSVLRRKPLPVAVPLLPALHAVG